MTTTINNEHKKLNVPNLRFKEFQGEWEKRTLDKVCVFHNGRAYKQNELLQSGKYRVLRVGNFFTNDSWYYSNLELEEEKIAVRGDLLYAWSASFGPRFWHEEKVIYHYHIWKVDSFQNVTKSYLYYYLEKDATKIKNEVQGGTMVHITKGDMEKRAITYPCIEEQKKIAKLLSIIDERISTQSKIIEDLKKLKSAIIEIEYTPNAKTTSHIGDIIEQISKRNKNNAIQNVLSVSNRQGFIKQSDQFENRNVASEDTSNYKIVEQNDFAFNPARINVGSIARLTTFQRGIVSPMYICFRTQENVAPEYIDYFFESKHFYCEIQKRLEGSVRQCLSFEGLCNIPLSLPSLEMQQRIGKRLFTLGQKIKTETDLLKLLNKQKQYLLRQMFI